MKTIRNHLVNLKPAHRDAALTNMNPDGMTRTASSIDQALTRAFNWKESPEGYDFWDGICLDLVTCAYNFTEEESAGREGIFPEDDGERQKYPLAQTDLFFPVADAEFSKFCMVNQQKHCPEATKVTWAKDRSVGDGSQLRRHLMEFLKAVEDGDIEKANKEIKSVDWRGRELSQRWHTKMPPFDK